MKTLNEQIERLRALVRKAYGTVAAKGGNVPDVGERTMENLSAAIESVPSPVKVKVSSLKINANCVNEEGEWECAAFLDTSAVTSFDMLSYNNKALVKADVSNWDTSNVTNMSNAFGACDYLEYLDVSKWDTSNVTIMNQLFGYSKKLRSMDVSNWDTSNVTNMNNVFTDKRNVEGGIYELDLRKWVAHKVTIIGSAFFPTYILIRTLVGGESIESVIANNTKILDGISINVGFSDRCYCEDRASLRAIINGLADMNGKDARVLSINKGKMSNMTNSAFDTLTEEDIAVAVAKNWTITSIG